MWKKPLKINVKKLIPNTFGKLISWQVNWERNEVNMLLIRRIWKGEWKMPLLHHFVDNPEHRLADYPKHCYWMQTQWCCPVQIRLEEQPSEIEKQKKASVNFLILFSKKLNTESKIEQRTIMRDSILLYRLDSLSRVKMVFLKEQKKLILNKIYCN